MGEQELLEKWKRRLCLHEWKIELYVNCKPEEMTMSGVAGCTEWSEADKTARIEIIDPKYYGEHIVPFNFEKTLIHELLHLKMSFWCQNGDDVGDRVMHQTIDDLARAFVGAVPVVRCRECKHLNVVNRKELYAHCPKTNTVFLPFELDTREHFCSLGERKEGAV